MMLPWASMSPTVRSQPSGQKANPDLRAVSGIPTVERGAAVTLVGFEGSRPDQLAAQAIYPPDLTPAPADAPSVRSERLDGRIESLAGDRWCWCGRPTAIGARSCCVASVPRPDGRWSAVPR